MDCYTPFKWLSLLQARQGRDSPLFQQRECCWFAIRVVYTIFWQVQSKTSVIPICLMHLQGLSKPFSLHTSTISADCVKFQTSVTIPERGQSFLQPGIPAEVTNVIPTQEAKLEQHVISIAAAAPVSTQDAIRQSTECRSPVFWQHSGSNTCVQMFT